VASKKTTLPKATLPQNEIEMRLDYNWPLATDHCFLANGH